MKISKNIRIAALLVALLPGTLAARSGKKPNIIVFLVDDMGWMDTSVPFGDRIMELNKRYHTPNMEALARQGMKFTNAYATPVCSPSRVSLLTGMNSAHHRVTNFTELVKDLPTDAADSVFKAPDWNLNGLSPQPDIPHTVYATPLPQLLRNAGYYTIHSGKAHLATSGTPGVNPCNLGYIVNISGNMAGMPLSYLGTENFGNVPGMFTHHAIQDMAEYYGTETFLTEALTRETLKSLLYPVKEKKPFFLYMAQYAVHGPIQADNRFYKKYLDAGLDSGQAKYAAMVEGMDKSLGDIMSFLKANNIDKNTVILFMSDNGGQATTKAKGGKRLTQNLPLRSGKGSVYEGGIRVPMIVKWPGKVRAGSKSDRPVIVEDFFPAVLEIAGVKNMAPVQKVDGESFVPALKENSKGSRERALIWHYPHKWNKVDYPGINYFSAIRVGDWKVVHNMKEGKLELYNIKMDIGELKNVAAEYPQKVKELSARLTQKLLEWHAQMPVNKLTGKPVEWAEALTQTF